MPTYSSLHAHVVFATRHRRPWISDPARLHQYLGGTLRGLEAVPVAVGGTSDHVHLLFGYRPSKSIADLVREMKKASTAWGRQHLDGEAEWQEGYAVFAVGAGDLADVVAYIENQEAHHRLVSPRDEYVELCRLAGIEVDPRYLD